MAWRSFPINRILLSVGCGLLLGFCLVSLGNGRGVDAAELGPEYTLGWHTTQVGGGFSQGGAFSVTGTVGQADTAQIQGGDFAVSGGYWNEHSETSIPLTNQIFLPWISR